MRKLLIVLGLCLPSVVFAQSYAAGTRVEVLPDDGGATGELRFREAWGAGGHYLAFKAPAALAGTVTWTLPAADGTSGQALVTDGAGVLSWGAGGGGGSYYQTMRTYAGSDLPQRTALRVVSQALNLYDDPDGADGDAQAETELALATSPSNALVVVGTGRTVTGSNGLKVNGFAGSGVALAADLTVSANTSPVVSTTLVGTGRTVIATAPLLVNGTTSATLAADFSLTCPTCTTTTGSPVITGSWAFENITSFGGGGSFGRAALTNDLGTTLVDIEAVTVSGSFDIGQITLDNTSTTTRTVINPAAVEIIPIGGGNPTRLVSGGIDDNTGVWSFTQNGIVQDSQTVLDTSRNFYGKSGVVGATSTLSCAAGQAVKAITVSGGIVTSVSCGAP